MRARTQCEDAMDATRKMTLLVLLMLTVVGCRNGKNNELVEREMRMQEDRIYQLKDYIDQYQSMLESSRRENDSLRKELGKDPQSDDSSKGFEPPKIDLDNGGSGTDSLLTPPVIEPGIPSGSDLPGGDAPSFNPGPVLEDFSPPDSTPRGEASELKINPRLTGGLDMNGHPGDEGVMVVVEPRDAQGELVRSEGKVSLMVVDPNKDGISGQVARWDFSAEEADEAWRKSLLGHGLHFELPWPNEPPKVDRLRLYVRLVPPEGQKILAEADFDVDRLEVNSPEEVRPLLGDQPQDGFTARAPSNSWSRSERARQVKPKRTDRSRAPREPKVGITSEKSAPRGDSVIREARNKRPIWKPFR